MATHTNFQQIILQVLQERVGKTYAQDKVHDWKHAGVKSDGDALLWAAVHLDPGNLNAVLVAIGCARVDGSSLRSLSSCIRMCQPLQQVAG
ncbi:MAG: hypothetical protein V4706_01800 [Pseudomonadota bacterium]